jgi:predicted alpha/beta-hydrolase family hydrolase
MIDLSPAAQAVLDAFNREARPEPHHQREAIAAAIRAAAYQIQFEGQLGITAYGGHAQAQRQLNTIADELENANV